MLWFDRDEEGRVWMHFDRGGMLESVEIQHDPKRLVEIVGKTFEEAKK